MKHLLLLLLTACGAEPDADAPTWYGDVEPIVASSCTGCHNADGIAPFPLTTYAEARPLAAMMADAVADRRMPPWLAGPDCTTYEGDISLSDEAIAMIGDWANAGAPEGDPADGLPVDERVPGLVSSLSRVDETLSMAEPYTPVTAPDDYRCFVLDWEAGETYVTGFRAVPGNPAVVHHVIAFLAGPDERAEYEALDAAEAGPGYTCYGGPGGTMGAARWLGAWAPGAVAGDFPAGTGIPVEAGSAVILQLHYNLAEPGAESDQTAIELVLADEVDKPARVQPFTNPAWLMTDSMSLPADTEGITHSYEHVVANDGLVYSASLHMHTYGRSGRLGIGREDGSEACMLDIPSWDFHWQRSYRFAEPKPIAAGETLQIECTWDNTTDHDLAWGEGTGDEMCLGAMYLTAP